MITPGRYHHHKGGYYEVLFTAKDEATSEPMVVYRNEAHGTLYVRSLENFTEKLPSGQVRFAYSGPLKED